MREDVRQQFLNLIGAMLAGFAAGQDVQVLRRQLQDGLEAWDRLDAEQWLEIQGKALKPRKPRDTAAKRRRALLAAIAAAQS